MAITTITQIPVQESRLDDFLQLVKENAPDTRASPGCVSFTFLTNPEDAGAVTFIEVWESNDAQQAYVDKRTHDGSMEKLGDFFAGAPETSILKPAT